MEAKKSITISEAKKNIERYCAYQERCHKEVVNKLKDLGIIQNAIDIIVADLIQNNYLNETRFAQSFARGKFRIKKWGKVKIRRELNKREISEYNIKMGMKEISNSDYEETFNKLLDKKLSELSHLSESKQKRKIFNYLSYRGWEVEKIFDKFSNTDVFLVFIIRIRKPHLVH